MDQYNLAMIGTKDLFDKARAYAQRFMPFKQGEPDGWVFSKEDIPYVGTCQVLKTLSKDVAELAAKAFKNIEGLLVLTPVISELER